MLCCLVQHTSNVLQFNITVSQRRQRGIVEVLQMHNKAAQPLLCSHFRPVPIQQSASRLAVDGLLLWSWASI